MAMDDFNIGFLAGLDGTKSKAKLNQDIDAIKKSLKELELKAKLDPNQVKALENQLNSLKVSLTNVSFDQTSLNNLVSQINNSLSGIKLQIPNLNTGNAVGQAQKAGQQIGQNINQGISQSLLRDKSTVKFEEYFKQSGNAAKEAQQYFQNLLQSENATVAVLERFDDSKLNSFTVNVKRASGEVESLHYQLRNLGDNDNPDMWFKFTGGNTNDASAIKQIKDIENAFSDYTAKLSQFKSTNSEILSGLTTPLSDFETKLAGLKNGTSTINEVANAYKSLNAEASNITKNFSRQLSPIDSAIRNLAKGEETISGLRAEFKGLNNAPKEINTELTKCAKLLENVKKIESQEGRTENWSQAYRQWSDSVDTLQAKLKTLRKEQSNVASTQIFNTSDLKNNNIAYMSKVYNTIEKQMVEINRLAKAKDWQVVDVSGVEQADGKIKKLTLTVRDAEGALKKLDMQREKLQGNGKAQYGLMQVGDVKILETASQAQEKLAQSTEKANVKLAEQANKIQLSFDTGSYQSKVDSLVARTNQWVDANGNARISTESLQTALNNLGTAYTNLNSSGGNTVANQQALIEAEKALDIEVKKVQSSITSMNSTMAKSSAVDALRQKYQMFYDTNTAAHRKWGKSLLSAISELAPGAEVSKQRIKELEQGLINTSNAARQAGKLGLSFFDTIKQGMQKFSYWTSSTFIIMKTIQEIKEAVSFAKEMDSALTNINYTMDVTKSQLTDIGNSSIQMAKDLKTSASDILGAVTLYANAKETADSILKKSEAAIMLGNVTGMSGQESAKALQSVMNQFELTQDDLMYISDTIQKVSQNMAYDFSSGIEEIVGGIERSGSVAKAAGLDLNEYASMLGLVIEKTGLSGETIGTAYRTILTRITKASKIEGTSDEDISKAETALNAIGVQVRSTAGEFRDMTDIMEDLGKVWNNLNDVQQANISYEIAGTRQTNIIKTLLGYWTDYEDLATKAGDAAGTTLENQSKYEETLDAKTKELSTTMQSFWHNLIGAEEANGVLAIFQKVATALDTISGKLGSLGTIGLGAGLLASFKGAGRVKIAYPHLYTYACRNKTLYA